MTPTLLIEGTPTKLGRVNRSLSIIEGATLISSQSVNGATRKRRYSEAALKKIATMAEGLPGYLNHVAPADAFKPRDVKDLAVRHRNVRYDPTTMTVKSDMHVVAAHAPLVFGLAEQFGDHIGNSLVSKGVVTMDGDTEVVQDVVALRSADLVSDPAATKGLFESIQGDAAAVVTLTEMIAALPPRENPHARLLRITRDQAAPVVLTEAQRQAAYGRITGRSVTLIPRSAHAALAKAVAR
jgi:hypothetical protein